MHNEFENSFILLTTMIKGGLTAVHISPHKTAPSSDTNARNMAGFWAILTDYSCNKSLISFIYILCIVPHCELIRIINHYKYEGNYLV